MSTPEGRLKTVILSYLKLHGEAVKIHVGAFGPLGEPDVHACVCGQMIVLEIKEGDNQPTRTQRLRLAAWRRAGAIAATVWSLDEVKQIVERILAQRLAASTEQRG